MYGRAKTKILFKHRLTSEGITVILRCEGLRTALQKCKSELFPYLIIFRANSISIWDFEFLKLISKGAYGRVWLVKRKATGDLYAMKLIDSSDKVIAIDCMAVAHTQES